MKTIINKKRYDLDSATCVAEVTCVDSWNAIQHISAYRTAAGQYLLYITDGVGAVDDIVVPLTEDEAMEFLHLYVGISTPIIIKNNIKERGGREK